MPDRNKLAVYQNLGLRIVRSCATCDFARFPHIQSSWGNCMKHEYVHAKHDPAPRPLPANVAFVCESWEQAKNLSNRREIGSYSDLLKSDRLR